MSKIAAASLTGLFSFVLISCAEFRLTSPVKVDFTSMDDCVAGIQAIAGQGIATISSKTVEQVAGVLDDRSTFFCKQELTAEGQTVFRAYTDTLMTGAGITQSDYL